MPKKAGNVQLTAEQQRDLHAMLVKASPTDMPRDVYEAWVVNQRGLNRAVRRLLLPLVGQPQVIPALQHDVDTLAQLEDWERHYRDEYGMTVDFEGLFIPIRRDWTKRLIVVVQSLTCNQVYAKCESLFPCWRWTSDLDAAVKGLNEREPIQPYAIWIRGDVEPDEVAMTANQTRAIGLSGTVLLEDLVMEPKYFKETNGEHLNQRKITRCDGSRSSDGDVPIVYWDGFKFNVNCCNPGNSFDCLRPRVAAS